MKAPNNFEAILLAEFNLGLPPLTFFKLIKEPSDWSFVLKLHTVLECALNCLLEKRMPAYDYDRPMTFVSKVQLAFELPMPARDDYYRNFFKNLNYIRNRFAHRANYILYDLKQVIQEIPLHRRNAVIESLAVGVKIPETSENDARNAELRQALFVKHPRNILHKNTIASCHASSLEL